MLGGILLVSFVASLAGAICGIGGGVIMKPVLDATGLLSVSSASFLSGCTVLSMAVISTVKTLKETESNIRFRIALPLAAGAAAGGMLGRTVFQQMKQLTGSESTIGLIQAVLLFLVTGGSLLYMLNQKRIKTKHIKNYGCCSLIGLVLGMLSAFLGIGGGPVNLVILAYFFSMAPKEGAANSIFIILFSQAASLAQNLVSGSVPEFQLRYLVIMTAGGIAGGILGSSFNKRLKEDQVRHLLVFLIIIILVINVYNAISFMGFDVYI